MGAFGEKLRQQRERRGIALDAISNATKISPRMLRALEDEHFEQLPGGVFNKGFVRAYARQIGLDEEETVTEYLAALRESQLQAQKLLPDFRTSPAKSVGTAAPGGANGKEDNKDNNNDSLRPASSERRKFTRRSDDRLAQAPRIEITRDEIPPEPDPDFSTPSGFITLGTAEASLPEGSSQPAAAASSQIPWSKWAGALLLVLVALAAWNFRRHRAPTAPSLPAASALQTPAPASAPPLVAKQPSGSAGSLTVEKESSPKTLSAGTSFTGAISAKTTPPASPTLSAAAAPLTAKSPAPSPLPSNPSAPKKSAANTASSAATKPPASFTLLIRAEKSTWVSIEADGKPVARETLIAPAHTSVRATREIIVKAGSAAGVSFLLNGKPLSTPGADGEARTYIFDSSGLRASNR